MAYYLKKYWKLNAAAVFFLIAVSVCQVLTSMAMIQITESIIARSAAGFVQWLVIDSIFFLLLLLFDQIGTVIQGRAVRKMNNHVRLDIAASIAHSDHQSFHAADEGEYLSQMTNDVNQIENLAWNNFYQCAAAAASVISGITALLLLHWSLAAASVLASIVLWNAPKLFGKKMESLGAACAQEQAQSTDKMKDLLSGFDVLRSFGQMHRFSTGMQEASDQIEQPKYHLAWMKNLANNSVTLVSLVVQMLINCLIGFLSIKGVILQGALLGGGNLCGSVSNGLANLGQFRIAFSAAAPYFEKITCHAEDADKTAALVFPSSCRSISMENISFAYGEKSVLNNQSFLFEKGGKYALTGPSGCGKSTVLKLLLGWLPDYQGDIRFDGKDARNLGQEQLLQNMSYIAQDVFLFHTTIRDNITLGSDFPEEAIEQAVRRSALEGDLANMPLGLDTPVGEDGRNLSGGQKQRIAIARALIHNRSVLLVDEGTSALDRKNADIVEQNLLSDPGLTLILVSHHLTEERKAQFTHIYELEPAVSE